ncbi:hypothetical protein ONE63_004762 [Megalurothrips usitatus]|uniref:Peptidase M14 domain-containing protein n=1 Tax=Megalurothrips usitatus TaxID=439358 RepID=A0AAV7X1H1_9NEOP|nr:hypothetical protein ONE63_004762 [Megalurothrips usitatus]
MRWLQLQPLLVLVAALAAAASGRSYRGYHLVHAVPRDSADAAVLQSMSSWSNVDMWNRRAVPGRETTLMVAPGAGQQRVLQRLEQEGVPYSRSEDDVQSMVEREAREQASAAAARLQHRRLHASEPNVTFDAFMRYDEIELYLRQLADKYPTLVTLQSVGKSAQGREMTVIRVSASDGAAPRAILVDAGIHAREWIAPATALYLIDQLVQHADEHRDLLDGLDWYILPLVNPDGYEYTHTTDRFWRKNRGADLLFLCERGADLNRNFDFHWMQSGASTFPCAETFAGKKAFSEPESQNMRDFMLQANKDKRVKMYLTLHSYGPMILYPWGYDYRVDDAPDAKELAAIGNEANAAMVAAGSEPFVVQNSAELYPAAGGSDDWAKGVANIAKSYTIELQGGGASGFDIPASRIAEVVAQTFQGFRVFAGHAQRL